MFNGTRNDYYGPSRTRETARSRAYKERIGMLEMERINEGIIDRLGIRQYMHLFQNQPESPASEAQESTATITAPQSFVHPESGQLVRMCQYGDQIHVSNTSTIHPSPAPKPSLPALQIVGTSIGQRDQPGECDQSVSNDTKQDLRQVLPYRRMTTPSQSTDSFKSQSVCSVDPSGPSRNHLEASSPISPSLLPANKVDNISTISTGGTTRTRSCHATTTGSQIVVGTGTVSVKSIIPSLAHKNIPRTSVPSVMLQCSAAGRSTAAVTDGNACLVKTFSNKELWPDPIWSYTRVSESKPPDIGLQHLVPRQTRRG